MTLKSAFPHIKEVRTFIIDGVGSGGDYHNVSIPSNTAILRTSSFSDWRKRDTWGEMSWLNVPPHHDLGQRWPLVGRQ